MTAEAAAADTGRWLPDEARLIALVRDRGSDEWAAGVATGLADMVGRQRGRTFLVNVAGAGALDELLDAAGGPGLTSALTGAATVASVARTRRDQRFAYLPAGEAALPYSALRRVQRFRRFLERVRDGGGTLLLYVGEEDLSAPDSRDDVPARRLALDGCITLGDAPGIAKRLGAPLLARVERPRRPSPAAARASAATAAPPSDASTSGTGDHAERPDVGAATGWWRNAGSLSRLLLPVGLLMVAWGGWSLLAGGGSEAGTGSAPVAGQGVGSPTGRSGAGEVARSGTEGVAPAEEGAAMPSPERQFAAPEARYSILVASYIRLEDGMARRAELSEEGGLFYVSPTPVRGRVYYRVLSGVYEDRADAAAGMADLVADGRKEAVKEWDVRPVRLAYDLGTFAERGAADRRAATLRAVDVPAYVLRDTAEAPLYRVYAGAFTGEADAESLGRRLAELDEGTRLISRSGVAP